MSNSQGTLTNVHERRSDSVSRGIYISEMILVVIAVEVCISLISIYIYISSLIKKGEGPSVVNLIKVIASYYRNISQDPVIYCLALCARSENVPTKKEAYQILNDICRIPTHLFQVTE